MKKENKNMVILIIFIIFLLISIFYFSSKIQKIESDLCYSLKVNRIFFEGIKDNIDSNLTYNNDIFNKFESNLQILENRNWMGCEE